MSIEVLSVEAFGKVGGGWPIAKSIRDICPISLGVLKPYRLFENEAHTAFDEKLACFQVAHKSQDHAVFF